MISLERIFAMRMISCSSTSLRARSSAVLRICSASRLAAPMNSARASTSRRASDSSMGKFVLISSMRSSALSRSMTHFSAPSGMPCLVDHVVEHFQKLLHAIAHGVYLLL
jgi:hypothetical protein